MNNKRIGSRFNQFLADEGILKYCSKKAKERITIKNKASHSLPVSRRSASQNKRKKNKSLSAQLSLAMLVINELRSDCFEAYQVIGAITSGIIYQEEDIIRVMDNLSHANNEEFRPHEDLLPWPMEVSEENQPATTSAQLENYKSEAFAAAHQSASALLRVGAITQSTMKEFDLSCLKRLPPSQ